MTDNLSNEIRNEIFNRMMALDRNPDSTYLEIEPAQIIIILNSLTVKDDEDLPTLMSLKGIAPNIIGNEQSENFVRKIRDEWDKPKTWGHVSRNIYNLGYNDGVKSEKAQQKRYKDLQEKALTVEDEGKCECPICVALRLADVFGITLSEDEPKKKFPKRIILNKTIRGDSIFRRVHAPPGIYEAHCNPHGAISVIATNGSMLGIKPGEYEVVEWVEDK